MLLPNRTDSFLSFLFPEQKQIEYMPMVDYDINSIIMQVVELYGKQGSGKTEFVRRTTELAVEKYGIENVNCVFSNHGSLHYLQRYALDDKMIQILFCDNLTLKKVSKQALADFFEIRHIWKARTGRSIGYILVFLGVHRFHGSPVELRTNLDALVCKNSPSSPFDFNVIKKFISANGVKDMEMLERERKNDPSLKRFSVFWRKGERGLLSLRMAKCNYMEEVCIPKTETYRMVQNILKQYRSY